MTQVVCFSHTGQGCGGRREGGAAPSSPANVLVFTGVAASPCRAFCVQPADIPEVRGTSGGDVPFVGNTVETVETVESCFELIDSVWPWNSLRSHSPP